MKKIAVVDDDMNYAKYIREEIYASEWGEDVEVDVYNAPDLFISGLKEGKIYDLCISDIEMPGKNGVELAEEIRRIDSGILLIFLTSYSKYAICGYKVDAFDYLLKEHFAEEWKRTLEKVKREFKRAEDECYLVDALTYFERISLNQIFYIYKDKRYAVFVLEDREIPVRKSLKQILQELSGKNQFILVERGHIVNIEKIKRFELREIEMVNGKRIPLGHIRTSEVREKIHSYYKGRF